VVHNVLFSIVLFFYTIIWKFRVQWMCILIKYYLYIHFYYFHHIQG